MQQLDPIYVDITQSRTEMLRLQRQLASGELVKDDNNQAEVRLTLEDGSVYPERGRLKVSEVSVDPSTGSVVLRAVFPNPRARAAAGHVRARARSRRARARRRCWCRSAASSHNPRGEATVLVVDTDDKVAERVVTADRAINGEWLITAGLTAGDRVDRRRPAEGEAGQPGEARAGGRRAGAARRRPARRHRQSEVAQR